MSYDDYYSKNIYYSPENFGLTTVGEIDWSSGSYEYSKTAVFKNAEGQFGYLEDAGCSCPTPFEDQSPDQIMWVTPQELQIHLDERNSDNYEGKRDAEIADIMLKVVS